MKKLLLLLVVLLFNTFSFAQEKFTLTNTSIQDGDEEIVRSLGRNVKISMDYELTDSTLTVIQTDKVVLKAFKENGYPIKQTFKIKLINSVNLSPTTLVRLYYAGDNFSGNKLKYTIIKKEECYSIVTESVDGFSGKYSKSTSFNIDCFK
jgi:hypothetical protein